MGARAVWFLQRSLSTTGIGLLAIGGLLGAVSLGALLEGRTPRAAPILTVAWVLFAGWLHVEAAARIERSSRWGWAAVAAEVPILAALVAAEWPLYAQEIVGIAIFWSIPLMLGGALLVARPPRERGE